MITDMKKIIFVFILLFSVVSFAETTIEDKLSDMIEKHQKEMIKKGYKFKSLRWEHEEFVYPKSIARYTMKLIENRTFVFYTCTTGPKVRSCIMDVENRTIDCTKASDKIILYYKPGHNGIYRHYIFSASDKDTGSHISYVYMMYKDKLKKDVLNAMHEYVNSSGKFH